MTSDSEKKRINKNLAVCERQTIVERRCPTHKIRCYHKQGFQKVNSAPGRATMRQGCQFGDAQTPMTGPFLPAGY